MKITQRQLRRIIREAVAEMLDAEHPSEVEAEEDAWSGFDNLHKDVDHANVHHDADPVVDSPEMLDVVGEHRSGAGAHMAKQKPSPMRSRASEALARVIRQQRQG